MQCYLESFPNLNYSIILFFEFILSVCNTLEKFNRQNTWEMVVACLKVDNFISGLDYYIDVLNMISKYVESLN